MVPGRRRTALRGNVAVIVGSSRSTVEVRSLVTRLARNNRSPVLIMGESGTGKSLIAQTLHSLGLHPNEALVTFPCRSGSGDGENFSEAVAALWTHVASVGKGSLLLEDIGDAPVPLQEAILSLIHGRVVRPPESEKGSPFKGRVIAITRRTLEGELAQGTFLRPLYEMLDARRIILIPLRKRPEDIPALIDHFVALSNREHGGRIRISRAANQLLTRYDWPDNAVELREVVLAVAASVGKDGRAILPEDLPARIRTARVADTPERAVAGESLKSARRRVIEAFEREFIWKYFHRNRYSVTATARAIGITRECLSQKLKYYGLKKKQVQRPNEGSAPIS